MVCANKDRVFKLTIQDVNEYIEDFSFLNKRTLIFDSFIKKTMYILCIMPYFIAFLVNDA